MSKITISSIGSLGSLTKINDAVQSVTGELNNKVLYRDNPDGEANQLEQELDMNSNDIANAKDIYTSRLYLNGVEATVLYSEAPDDSASITYDNTDSSLVATDVQDAIDELAKETVFAITDGASVDLDPANGGIQTWTLGADRTATESFISGQSMTLIITSADNALAWPTILWVGGDAPTLATGESIVWLFKVGSTLYGVYVGDPSSGGCAGWGDVSTASYDNVSFDIVPGYVTAKSVDFKPDGTKMYIVGGNENRVYQFTLSTAWDLSTASDDSVSYFFDGQGNSPTGVKFKPDGTKMYRVGASNTIVYQYSLSTAWDLSTGSYDSVSFDAVSFETVPQVSSLSSVGFKPDGTKMYVLAGGTNSVYQYTLSTAWDVSTAYISSGLSISSQDSSPGDIAFKPDGTKMYITGADNDSVYQYSLSTAWDLSTGSYDSDSFDTSSQDGNPKGLAFKHDGTKMYVVGAGNINVYQYSMCI